MIKFELVTLSGVKFGQEVYEVTLPTLAGQIGVLPGHMPLISVVTTGVIGVRHNASDRDSQVEYYATAGGVVEVKDNTLRVLVDEADASSEISEAEAQEAIKKAQDMLKNAKDQVSLDKAKAMMDRSAVRLQVAGLRRKNRR